MAAAGWSWRGSLQRQVLASKQDFVLQLDFSAAGELEKLPFSASLGAVKVEAPIKKGKHRLIYKVSANQVSAKLDGKELPVTAPKTVNKEIELKLLSHPEHTIQFSNLFLIQ